MPVFDAIKDESGIAKVSVIVCTRNRGEQLSTLLESLMRLEIPAGITWEAVIVDNGSTDYTAQTIQKFAEKIPLIYVYEGNPGLSNARNAGLKAASGKYCLWTDDDVIVTSGWLASYVKAFCAYPDAAIFGGKITPILDAPTPAWFSAASQQYLNDLLCIRDFGPSPRPLSFKNNYLPYGANFAIRTDEQKRHNYDPNLGVAPGRRRGGEEVDVITKILSSGHHGWWVPDPEVKHVIPVARQTIAYLKEYYCASGETSAYFILKNKKGIFTQTFSELLLKLPLSWLFYQIFRLARSPVSIRFLTGTSFHYGKTKYLLHNFAFSKDQPV